MTTLKPQLVRADTMDLQDQHAPSAGDHSRQPTHPAPYGFGPAAPHQNQALRHAERDNYIQQRHSPRISEDRQAPFPEEPNFYDEPDDEYDSEHIEDHNGTNGTHHDDHDMEDGDQGDDDMDDDLLDKISSSPSIDDGKYTLPVWPPRSDSVDSGAARSPLSTPPRGNSTVSSSPFNSTPDHYPLSMLKEVEPAPQSHQKVEYETPPRGQTTIYARMPTSNHESSESDLDMHEISMYLLPTDDPLLDNSFDDMNYEVYDNEDDWEDEDEGIVMDDDSSSLDDDSGNFHFTDDSRFIDSGWGGECLREIEDIDFEFVYALHTFVATVEGQANATKGDTMVLLDDSNSYWWLVRVVKDGSIGYLPAEHIETPTERLARLNKHRNIDLSATMLGDNPEKSKNPLKKAMKRRNQKTVQFTAPTYYEPSEYDGSEDEDDDEDDDQNAENRQAVQSQETGREDKVEQKAATLAPLAVNTESQENRPLVNGIKRITSDESMNSAAGSSPEKIQFPETVLTNGDAGDALSLSRRGNVRNTDSFFKDDTVETKKISLTPRLLRGDSDNNGNANAPEQDLRQRPSLETFDKMLDDGKKDDKKKKEKKGMLRGLFGRKEKTSKPGGSDGDDSSKVSDESVRYTPQLKDSLESLSSKQDNAPERKSSKLQKTQPNVVSPKTSPMEAKQPYTNGNQISPVEANRPLIPAGPAPLPPGQRPADNDPRNGGLTLNTAPQSRDQPQNRATAPGSSVEKKSMFAPITNVLRSNPSTSNIEDATVVKPVYAKRAKNRFAIDEGDSDDDRTPTEHQNHRSISPLGELQQTAMTHADSHGQVSPIDELDKQLAAPSQTQRPPVLSVDTHSNTPTPIMDGPGAFPVTPMQVDDSQLPDSDHTTSSIKDSPATDVPTPSTSRSTPTWSDASLRSYMDNDQDIRDLLIIVHDKSNIMPTGSDHPYVGSLFANERGRLAEMQANLDSMLTGWMARKNGGLLTR